MLLQTKLYLPPLRPNLVPRPRLIEQLNQGLKHGSRLTLVSAPAGFGKTTLVSDWVTGAGRPAAWLSLDEGDSDPARFLTYLVAALRTLGQLAGEGISAPVGSMGDGALAMLQSPQPPPIETILTVLLNEINAFPDEFLVVLDDYHVIEAKTVSPSKTVDDALSFILEHLPPQMHLVIATREDPNLPLARLRARGQLTELRVADLRFTNAEAAEFLHQVMGLNLSAADIAALEARTEGWIAGLQLAALSMRGQKDTAGFIESFTGSHHFVLDYLVEEVLDQQPKDVQTFLLRTSILDRLCGPLCDAVCSVETESSSLGSAVLLTPPASGQETLEYLAQANLFIVSLDNERRWYRYHHLFAGLLRQRLQQSTASSPENEEDVLTELHKRASQWYEENGLEIEAFQHAAAAGDVGRAERLIEGEGLPLQFRGMVTPVLNWLESLPKSVLNARPSLLVTYASALTMTGQLIESVEEKLQAAESAISDSAAQGLELDDKTRDLIGHIAAIRAMLAVPRNQLETIIVQSRRALEYLYPDNLPVRTTTSWTLGYAYQIQGDRAAASQAYAEAIAASQASGNVMVAIAANTCLGQVRESQNQLHQAADSYRQVLQLTGDPPWPGACEAYLGLARLLYQWNDLDGAQQHGQQSLHLAEQLVNVDTPAANRVFFARLKLARGDAAGAAALLNEADQFVRQNNFVHWLPEITATQVLILLRRGDRAAAAELAGQYDLPLSQARVKLAEGNPSTALAVLEQRRQQVEAKDWVDEQLKVMVLQTVALVVHGQEEEALRLLSDALALAEPGGPIRIFVNEGRPLAELLAKLQPEDARMQGYIHKLLTAFGRQQDVQPFEAILEKPSPLSSQPLLEPLSKRELEVLELVAQGLSNREIGERLYLALDTVKGHNRKIFAKLQVHRRTDAVVRARELGLL